MKRIFLLALLLSSCAQPGEREVSGVIDHAEWQAKFIGDALKTIRERQSQGGRTSAKNVYWFEEGKLRLYDSQRGASGLHLLFNSDGHVTKFSKRDDGRAVAVEPAEVKEVLARAYHLAAEARKALIVPAAR